MGEDISEKKEDLERAIENRTEDPEELLDPEDIDVDASDVEVDWLDKVKKCPYCGMKYKKVDEHTWKPNCDCHDKPIRIHIG